MSGRNAAHRRCRYKQHSLFETHAPAPAMQPHQPNTTPLDDLLDIQGLSAEEAGRLIMKAREHWFTEGHG